MLDKRRVSKWRWGQPAPHRKTRARARRRILTQLNPSRIITSSITAGTTTADSGTARKSSVQAVEIRPPGLVPLGRRRVLRHTTEIGFFRCSMSPSRDISRLIEIMAQLRTPVTGCPWDIEQNFQTIAPYTIEEAYEVADAIARNDLDDLKDELGDLLLQVVYHARMAEEQHAFSFGDVVEAICRKMIRRHPHVFADKNGNIAPAGVKSA